MSEHKQDPVDTHEHDPRDFPEAQIRQIYDEEEVERFISLFSMYVTEVRLSTGRPVTPPLPRRLNDCSLSEHIAYNYLLPHLPSAAGVPPFTLKRMSLTIQRLYLAVFPPYHTFLSNLVELALWRDYQRSLRYCILFWFLWFHNLLLPALVFRIIIGLSRRRLSAFPTLRELRERRQETAQALKFSEAVQKRLAVTTIGPVDMWRLFKLYKSGEKAGTDEEESLRHDMLHVLNELADLHERVKNVFTWRRPDVSRRCLLFFVVVCFGVLVLPTQYVAKLVYWFGGMLFWHVTPVIAALPRADRARVSLLFRDAPTDADYAMELIAKRIVAGQDIGVASLGNQLHRTSNPSSSTDSLASTLHSSFHEVKGSRDDGINWMKWGERVARGKSLAEEGRRFLFAQTSRNEIFGETTTVYHPGAEDAHTFLAQYTSSPGLIILTSSTLSFTSLSGPCARLVIPRHRLRGLRRSGILKGITITWAPEELMNEEEREEKFHWVGGRDELFARLVGSDEGRWIRT